MESGERLNAPASSSFTFDLHKNKEVILNIKQKEEKHKQFYIQGRTKCSGLLLFLNLTPRNRRRSTLFLIQVSYLTF